MIVLPGIPITPLRLASPNELAPLKTMVYSPETIAIRASISLEPPANHAELAQYLLRLEQYLEEGFSDLVTKSDSPSLEDVAGRALVNRLSVTLPWTNVVAPKLAKTISFLKPVVDWPLSAEIAATIIAISGVYISLGADLMGDLLEAPAPEPHSGQARECDEKWRQVAEHYKRALLALAFGSQFQSAARNHALAPLLFKLGIFVVLEKICHIGIQMSILCKSSWVNRNAFLCSESFAAANNGVLCRVAIWVFNEVAACLNLLRGLEAGALEKNALGLKCEKWHAYLAVFHKYVTAYSGLFLAIEYYQKERVGHAIGLLNFALVTLQRKSAGGADAKAGKLERLRSRLSGRKNDNYIAGLQLVTSLDIDKSVFLELSGAMLSDLLHLFDLLIMLHLKFSKENDNLRFEPVSDWKDTRADLKWPLGAQIPVSPARAYLPRAMAGTTDGQANQERASYY